MSQANITTPNEDCFDEELFLYLGKDINSTPIKEKAQSCFGQEMNLTLVKEKEQLNLKKDVNSTTVKNKDQLQYSEGNIPKIDDLCPQQADCVKQTVKAMLLNRRTESTAIHYEAASKKQPKKAHFSKSKRKPKSSIGQKKGATKVDKDTQTSLQLESCVPYYLIKAKELEMLCQVLNINFTKSIDCMISNQERLEQVKNYLPATGNHTNGCDSEGRNEVLMKTHLVSLDVKNIWQSRSRKEADAVSQRKKIGGKSGYSDAHLKLEEESLSKSPLEMCRPKVDGQYSCKNSFSNSHEVKVSVANELPLYSSGENKNISSVTHPSSKGQLNPLEKHQMPKPEGSESGTSVPVFVSQSNNTAVETPLHNSKVSASTKFVRKGNKLVRLVHCNGKTFEASFGEPSKVVGAHVSKETPLSGSNIQLGQQYGDMSPKAVVKMASGSVKRLSPASAKVGEEISFSTTNRHQQATAPSNGPCISNGGNNVRIVYVNRTGKTTSYCPVLKTEIQNNKAKPLAEKSLQQPSFSVETSSACRRNIKPDIMCHKNEDLVVSTSELSDLHKREKPAVLSETDECGVTCSQGLNKVHNQCGNMPEAWEQLDNTNCFKSDDLKPGTEEAIYPEKEIIGSHVRKRKTNSGLEAVNIVHSTASKKSKQSEESIQPDPQVEEWKNALKKKFLEVFCEQYNIQNTQSLALNGTKTCSSTAEEAYDQEKERGTELVIEIEDAETLEKTPISSLYENIEQGKRNENVNCTNTKRTSEAKEGSTDQTSDGRLPRMGKVITNTRVLKRITDTEKTRLGTENVDGVAMHIGKSLVQDNNQPSARKGAKAANVLDKKRPVGRPRKNKPVGRPRKEQSEPKTNDSVPTVVHKGCLSKKKTVFKSLRGSKLEIRSRAKKRKVAFKKGKEIVLITKQIRTKRKTNDSWKDLLEDSHFRIDEKELMSREPVNVKKMLKTVLGNRMNEKRKLNSLEHKTSAENVKHIGEDGHKTNVSDSEESWWSDGSSHGSHFPGYELHKGQLDSNNDRNVIATVKNNVSVTTATGSSGTDTELGEKP